MASDNNKLTHWTGHSSGNNDIISLRGGWFIHAKASYLTFSLVEWGMWCTPLSSNEVKLFWEQMLSSEAPMCPYMLDGSSMQRPSTWRLASSSYVMYASEFKWGDPLLRASLLLRGIHTFLHCWVVHPCKGISLNVQLHQVRYVMYASKFERGDPRFWGIHTSNRVYSFLF